MNIARLALDAVTCERGARRLFAPLSLQLHAGEWVHLQGENGVGKTTLLRTVCGLTPAASGSVLWQGQPIAQVRSALQSELLYLGHSLALKADLSPLENLQVDAQLRGHPTGTPQILDALAELGLNSLAHLPLRVLSQGQQRRVALARLVLSRAALWVLDEPWVALDAKSMQALTQRLDAHVQAGGSLLFTSHQPAALTSAGQIVSLQR